MMQQSMVDGSRSIPTSLGMVANMLGATADLANAVRSLPEPIWNYLLAPHTAQQHDYLPLSSRPSQICLPCAFQTMVEAANPRVDPVTVKLSRVEDTQPLPKLNFDTLIFNGVEP